MIVSSIYSSLCFKKNIYVKPNDKYTYKIICLLKIELGRAWPGSESAKAITCYISIPCGY